MEILMHTKKIREYCDYLDEHVQNVRKAWESLKLSCKDLPFVYDDYRYFHIEQMVREHDLSKVTPEEFIPYQRRFCPVGEPDKEGFKDAWEHHQEHNPHHWQNWTKKDFYNPYEPEMHCVCMVIDWMAMAYKFGGSAEQYYTDNADEIELPDWAVSFIGAIFERERGAGQAAKHE